MALGFTSHYKSSEQTFGALTQSAYNTDSESAGSVSSSSSIIIGQNTAFFNKSLNYDNCEFSSSVVIDYSQYAAIAEGSSSETAGSIAYVGGGGDFSGGASGGGVASFSGGGCGAGGVSCASFTC